MAIDTSSPPPPPTKGDADAAPPRRLGRWIALGALILVPVLAYLAFGYFGVQFLFFDDEVNEAPPTFGAAPTEVVGETEAAPAEPGDAGSTEEATADGAAIDAPTGPAVETITLAEGPFEGRAHPTSGVATVLTDGSEQRVLRFEDFATDNGPDLNVYLVADGDQSNGFVDLGNLKGNLGSQNYDIPTDVDLEMYDTVVIWCVRFSVSFGEAGLTIA